MAKLYHPELDVTIERTGAAVAVHVNKGWVLADEVIPAESPVDDGYEAMTWRELGHEHSLRELDAPRTKQERVDSLREDDDRRRNGWAS